MCLHMFTRDSNKNKNNHHYWYGYQPTPRCTNVMYTSFKPRTTWSQAGLIILAKTFSRSCLFKNWNKPQQYDVYFPSLISI